MCIRDRTCYDATTARWLQRAGVPLLLVGDTAAEMILGEPGTIHAPLEFMLLLTAAVKRGAPNTFIMGDMPFGSYQCDDAEAIRNAGRFLTEGRADAVKLEADASFAPVFACPRLFVFDSGYMQSLCLVVACSRDLGGHAGYMQSLGRGVACARDLGGPAGYMQSLGLGVAWALHLGGAAGWRGWVGRTSIIHQARRAMPASSSGVIHSPRWEYPSPGRARSR